MSNLAHMREHKDQFLKTDAHSPLSEARKRKFLGLEYYAETPNLRFDVELERPERRERVHMQTSTGEVQEYLILGTFSFEVDGQSVSLTVYGSDDGDAFVPFVDSTSGSETYGAGRYLDLEWLGGDRYHVDFNLAYNPWCAYSAQYSCPFPPPGNRLQVPIRAGEKDFPSH
jgi:uncharacterized protein (DUF1684 family)